MKHSLSSKFAILAAAGFTLAGAASAGTWQLDPRACPDLVEDRLDRRVTTGRADLREDIRDMRQVNCPASAWRYVPSRGEVVQARRVYAGSRVVYVGRKGYYQFKTVPKRRYRQPALINIVIR